MEYILTSNEVRVLGVLIEKELTTPEYYPLTLNAIVNGCNQKSNRDPVMSLSEEDVQQAAEGLRFKHLVWRRQPSGSRVEKYEHNTVVCLSLSSEQLAVLCTLFLRGPQTIGELRNHTERMIKLESPETVGAVLDELAKKEGGPLVALLPRQPGQKESRYAHLLAGEVIIDSHADTTTGMTTQTPASSLSTRTEILEQDIAELKREFSELKAQFEQFKRSFE